jgi:prophage antirepressor-like protein
MNNDIQIFTNPEFGEIRTICEDDKVLFCGSDVAKSLGYDQPHKAIDRHCRYGTKRTIPHPQSPEKSIEMLFIPESDVYRLAFGSKLPAAEKFTDWVTEEVLPSIRKNGGYIAGQESMTPAELMASALLMAQRTLAEREARIADLTVQNQIMLPKAEYFDDCMARGGLMNFRDTAKLLGLKQKELIDNLLRDRYLYRDKRGRLLPYEKRNDGYLQVKEAFNNASDWNGVQTLVTPKGREHFRSLYPCA